MPRLDLLLLPILGGYVFLITFNLTKYYHQRIDKQKLVFNSILAAIGLSFISLIIDEHILKRFPEFREIIGGLIPINKEGLNESLLILGISYLSALLLNFIISDSLMYNLTIKRWGTDMERMFWRSIKEKQLADKLIMITTSLGKVYIGYVNTISKPIGHSSITIIPYMSGFRDQNDKRVRLTTNYVPIIMKYLNNNEVEKIDDKFGIVLPIEIISLVSKFDINIYNSFHSKKSNNSSSNRGGVDRKE